uniref:Phospholipase n=1 Tax=Mycena chlorophos TaxID=658473 RepID=A0ABQ0LHR7_MYCCL|nr:phospholipase D [Mycena chlorophos]
MDGLAAVVDAARSDQQTSKSSASISSSTQPRPIAFDGPRQSTPSMRTGPPRSLSYGMSLPTTPVVGPRRKGYSEDDAQDPEQQDGMLPFSFSRQSEDGFRTPLERPGGDRKGKKRESRILDDSWNPLRWFQDSPQEDKPGPFTAEPEAANGDATAEPNAEAKDEESGSQTRTRVRRSSSVPYSPSEKKTAPKWGRLRSLLPHIASQAKPETPGPSTVTPATVNITDELIAGGLSTLMLRMWFERDEKNHRRIPALFHRLRIRVTDSINPLHGKKSVFRIECEYANGAVRWVVYRQLRDFFSLHAHYAFSNAYNRNIDDLPEFPRTSIPYLKFLQQKENQHIGHRDFARLQRENLETYLINLIRAVMFHPSVNRLAGFLEVSALFINLAPSGGHQLKGGYLQIEATKGGGGFGRKAATWSEKKESRWCTVRDSYIVVMQEPGELSVWDVFLLDADFDIERPKRYYRQGLKLLQGGSDDEREEPHQDTEGHLKPPGTDHDARSVMGSIRSSISRLVHPKRHRNPTVDDASSISSASSNSSISSQPAMLDPSTNPNPLADEPEQNNVERNWHPSEKRKKKNTGDESKHTFYIVNSQLRLKLFARNERQMLQWITALERVKSSPYCQPNRFDSFAPIRLNVAAQWLVDGRDYFWNLSRALLLARETIYIHDWWLSPELQLRRPNREHYRLDYLLERKAREGVKIYVILYQEVSSRTTPVDSNYAKQRLSALHPNIFVQRSPSHFQTGTFYWAHHEKLCVIDSTIAFMGGLDLCFGRWDTAQHVVVDDGDGEERIWHGKDYSNPRVVDFHSLEKPEEDMYQRDETPRMPWHDVGMQVVGQPARDLCRHFVQRWNYLLRIKNHTRVMPFLLPPPEFKPSELTSMQLTGTCEMQILRSAGLWSLGTKKTEHSIQNAYLKAIQLSEHFVYIENQFFITSTVVNDVKIENKIGDAIVKRIIRAHNDKLPWKCCIVIPLLPGFTFPLDHGDASAIRIILECQNRTIARGPNSIFSRLRKEGIDPNQYISVFSLRSWGKLKGDILTTEQLYIHGKVCIVDDRLAIIGSANINERSQRGDRDSELAAIIRDTEMIPGKMAGKSFQVGQFAHSLRMRLMREHLGVDVDAIDQEDLMSREPVIPEHEQDKWVPDADENDGYVKESKSKPAAKLLAQTVLDGMNQALHGSAEAGEHSLSKGLKKVGLAHTQATKKAGDAALDAERQVHQQDGSLREGFASSMVPTLEEKILMEHRPPENQAEDKPIADKLEDGTAEAEGDEVPEEAKPKEGSSENEQPTQNGEPTQNGQPAQNGKPTQNGQPTENGHASDENTPKVSEGGTQNGTPPQIRTPDGELYGAPADASRDTKTDDQPPHRRSGVDDAEGEEKLAPKARSIVRRHLNAKLNNKTWTLPAPRPKVHADMFEDPISDEFWDNVWVASAVHNTEIYRRVFHAVPDDTVTTWKAYKDFVLHHERLKKQPIDDPGHPEGVARVPSEVEDNLAPPNGRSPSPNPGNGSKVNVDKEPTGTEPFERWERDEMEKMLGDLNGHLVVYPNRFLEGEDVANNFLFNTDRILPLPIYD